MSREPNEAIAEPWGGAAVGYGEHLRAVIGSSAAPYGYTLTIWTSGAVATHRLGIPNGWQAVLLLVGAVCAFAGIGALAHGGPNQTFSQARIQAVRIWGAFHLISTAAAIGASWLIVTVIDGTLAWPLVGLVATLIYLLGLAAQFTAADARRS